MTRIVIEKILYVRKDWNRVTLFISFTWFTYTSLEMVWVMQKKYRASKMKNKFILFFRDASVLRALKVDWLYKKKLSKKPKKPNMIKQNKIKQNKIKQNKIKQNKIKQKIKQNKIKK